MAGGDDLSPTGLPSRCWLLVMPRSAVVLSADSGNARAVLCWSGGHLVHGSAGFHPRDCTDEQWRSFGRIVQAAAFAYSLPARTDSVSVARSRDLWEIPGSRKNVRPVHQIDRAHQETISRPPRSTSVRFVRRQLHVFALAAIDNKRRTYATGVPRETISNEALAPFRASAAALRTLVFTSSVGHNVALTRNAPTCRWPLDRSTQ